jgi:putative spermidine/putrescine transport system permease protein
MDTAIATPAPLQRAPSRQVSWAWLGMLPFLLLMFAFLIYPSLTILSGSFRGQEGEFTLDNIAGLFQANILAAYRVSLEVSAITAVVGACMGALLAYAITWGGLHGRVRSGVITFASVAANFGGIPLAFAFITLMGRTGALPVFLRNNLGIDLYGNGFSIYTVQGLMLAYLYFQFPLMVLIMVPAFDGLKREWREAAANLGGSSLDFWRYVGIPILLPSFLGATVLLFGNAFGAYATAEALTGSKVDVITRVISRQIRGDVLYNPGLSYALALGMVVILAISIALYVWLQRITTRWLRQ